MTDELKDFLFELLSSIDDIAEQEDDGSYYIRAEKANYVGFIKEDVKLELEQYLDTLCE
jgi:hypothetical protein